MAVGLFLNFEKVSIEIIEQQIAKMTNDNVFHYEESFVDEIDVNSFVENLKYGSVAIVFIQNLLETSLNTILRRRANITEAEILRESIAVKLQIISILYKFDLSRIKAHHSYEVYKEIEKIRNDITHFKSNILCESSIIPANIRIELGTSKKSLATIFTKNYINESFEQIKKLIEIICTNCNLYINDNVQIIDCDGRDDICEYIVNSNPSERI